MTAVYIVSDKSQKTLNFTETLNDTGGKNEQDQNY